MHNSVFQTTTTDGLCLGNKMLKPLSKEVVDYLKLPIVEAGRILPVDVLGISLKFCFDGTSWLDYYNPPVSDRIKQRARLAGKSYSSYTNISQFMTEWERPEYEVEAMLAIESLLDSLAISYTTEEEKTTTLAKMTQVILNQVLDARHKPKMEKKS